MPRTTRRDFLRTSVAGVALPLAAPIVRGDDAAPSERVRIAAVGVGGKGWADLSGASKHAEVVAFCDVAETPAGRKGGFGAAAERFPKARRYRDWRRMLDAEAKNLDGITVSTPDHMHAPVTATAMRLGLGCYTQKPLTRTVHEARVLTRIAEETKVATQMGNQHHSGLGYRLLVELVRAGHLGKVTAAHTWSNRPIWPQGIDRPAGSDTVPEGLDWDLWLGVARERPFKSNVYHPFKWRGWYDFGAGALGDMGCHIIDPVVWSLELGPPKSVAYEGPKPNPETFPKNEALTYHFAGTKHTADKTTFAMTWYDGGRQPSVEVSPHLPDGTKLPSNGVLLVGTEGSLVCPHGGLPSAYPTERFKGLDLEIPNLPFDHYGMWVDAIRNGGEGNSGFSYAGPLTETVLLGVIASRVGAGELKWDAERGTFTNSDTANGFIREEYREGWSVEGLG